MDRTISNQPERSARVVQGDIPVPVALRIFVERGKHNRQYDLNVIADEIAEVFIVPEI